MNTMPSTPDHKPTSLQPAQSQFEWWQTGIIYQIYPRSLQDSNADGVGDLAGITSRLDYFPWLGIDAIWISPIYPSPMADFGYDVSDYKDIDPLFGTLSDFDTLLEEAHKRGLKVILDFVPNHTSDQHPWFIESRSSRDNPKRDWYIWADPSPDGGPPNNWLSVFGGSAWELDATTGQYYLHSFLKEQPDLNWRNPDVESAMLDVLRFWLDKGVDGFRVDVIDRLIKDDQLRDDPPNPDWEQGMEPYRELLHVYSMDRPELHPLLRRMRSLLDSYPDRVMIGESYLPVEELVKLYGKQGDEAHMPFNFGLIRTPWDCMRIREFIDRYEAVLPPGAWPNWVLGNHDRHRVATRVGPDQARLAQMLLLTLRGTPTCYYGDEIGMTNVDIPPDRVQDPWGRNVPGLGLGRDPERTPMQWDPGPYAGFSRVEPWLPLADDYPQVNVAVEQSSANSMLCFFYTLVRLRRAVSALTVGTYKGVNAGPDSILAYLREHEDKRVLVVLNFSDAPHTVDLSDCGDRAQPLLSTYCDRTEQEPLQKLQLRANEGIILHLQ
jgi:alpha-glucosidase